MSDPVTALGLASNILTLVDFGAQCLKGAREIAEYGCTDEQRRLGSITSDLHSVSEEIEKQKGSDELRSLAAQTKDVAQELSQLLEKVHIDIDDKGEEQPILGKKKRRRAVAKSLVQSMWNRNDIKKLEHSMAHLREQMMLRLIAFQSQSLSDVLSHLPARDQGVPNKRIDILRHHEEHLITAQAQDVGSEPCETAARETVNMISCLKGLADQGWIVVQCQHLLKSLDFESLRSREQMIARAHELTFTWIFKEKHLGFVDWAEVKNGVFWITGKPGSGKSTLMKYLLGESRTYELLRKWAGTDRLGVASHYFWNPGTSMQKSEEGLLRKLLHDVVGQFPAEALKAFFRVSGNTDGNFKWTVDRLRRTLETFGQNEDLGAKLCFFIDGLDEYHSDHEDLVECLSRLAKCPSIKLCLSSRPWNLFNRAYKGCAQGQLAMQELTRGDIENFIDDRMKASVSFRALQAIHPRDCAEMLLEIRDKAQGVFLWVHLVVRSLLRGLHDNGDDINILRERVKEYPDTLDGYFDRMLQRVEKVYKKQSARILLVALATEHPLPLRAPSYIEQEMRDSDYALNLPVCRGPKIGKDSDAACGISLLKENELTTHNNPAPSAILEELTDLTTVPDVEPQEIERTRRSIDARCGDLLEVNVKQRSITFLHRTARDFLLQENISENMRRLATKDVDASLSVARLSLAQAKSVWPRRGAELGHLQRQVLEMQDKISANSGKPYADVLKELDWLGSTLFKRRDGSSLFEQPEKREPPTYRASRVTRQRDTFQYA